MDNLAPKADIWTKFSRIFETTGDFTKMLNLISEFAKEFFQTDRVSLAIYDEGADQFVLYTLDRSVEGLRDGVTLDAEGTMVKRVVCDEATYIWSELPLQGDFSGNEFTDVSGLLAAGYKSCLDSALVLNGKKLGTLNFGSRNALCFSQEDKATVNSLAKFVSAALSFRGLADGDIESGAASIDHLVDYVFKGDVVALVEQLISNRELSPDDMERLRALIDDVS